jgi:hypothetical protein
MTPRIASLFAPLVASAALLGSSACASARTMAAISALESGRAPTARA